MKRVMQGLVLLACASSMCAGTDIFSLVPTVKAPNIIYTGQSAIAYYQVMNNTPLTLSNIKLANLPAGVTQDPVGSGLSPSTNPSVGIVTCHAPFSLEPFASCLLKLNISADAMSGNIFGGPKVCQETAQGGQLFCSTPGQGNNILSVVKGGAVPSNAPTLSLQLLPTTLSFPMDLATGDLQTVQVTNNSSTQTVNNITADFSGTALAGKVVTVTPNPGGEAECTSVAPGDSCVLSLVSYSQETRLPSSGAVTFSIQGSNSQAATATAFASFANPNICYAALLNSPLLDADVWEDTTTPRIMSANYAFEGIQAVPNGEQHVINAGGQWNILTDRTPTPAYQAYTSTGDSATIAAPYGYPVYYDDAMPICFNMPIIASTVNPTDIQLTLNTGEVVTPDVASITPNFFYNETSCIVIFGRFGNRIPPGQTGAVYPQTVRIVEGSSNGTTYNLHLIDASGVVHSAVGLTYDSAAAGSPYLANGGPSLLAAKLSTLDATALATQVTQDCVNGNVPNDGYTMYASQTTQPLYRLRMYTSGGFALGNFTPSPDRSMSLMPSDYNNFFRVQVGLGSGADNRCQDGDTSCSYIYSSGKTYNTAYGQLTVLGLASLGKAGTPENDAYVADNNNYIDVILVGDLTAIQQISYLDIPTTGTNPDNGDSPYLKLYNPGGPGNNPTSGVTYSVAGPAVHIAVQQALTPTTRNTVYCANLADCCSPLTTCASTDLANGEPLKAA